MITCSGHITECDCNVKAPYFLVAELAPLMGGEAKGQSSMYLRWLPITECPA